MCSTFAGNKISNSGGGVIGAAYIQAILNGTNKFSRNSGASILVSSVNNSSTSKHIDYPKSWPTVGGICDEGRRVPTDDQQYKRRPRGDSICALTWADYFV